MTPVQRLRRAAIAYADATDDIEFKRAEDLLRKYAISYAYELVGQAQDERQQQANDDVPMSQPQEKVASSAEP